MSSGSPAPRALPRTSSLPEHRGIISNQPMMRDASSAGNIVRYSLPARTIQRIMFLHACIAMGPRHKKTERSYRVRDGAPYQLSLFCFLTGSSEIPAEPDRGLPAGTGAWLPAGPRGENGEGTGRPSPGHNPGRLLRQAGKTRSGRYRAPQHRPRTTMSSRPGEIP